MKNIIWATALALFLSAILLPACSSGRKAYQKGDYYTSCIKAIDRLKSDPNNKKARETLPLAYGLLVDTYDRDIHTHWNTGTLTSLDYAIILCERLNEVADAIRRTPGALQVVPKPVDFYEEYRELAVVAGDMYYTEGLKAFNRGSLQDSRTALKYFLQADEYLPGYKDLNTLIPRARYNATMRVIVIRPYTPSRYKIDADFFYTKMMSEISRRTYSNLVRFYTPEEASRLGMDDPHQLLVFNFEDFTIGNTKESSKTTEVKRDDVLVGTTTVDGQKQNVYGTVTAMYTYNRLEIISGGVLSIRTINPLTNKIISQKNISGQSVWFTEWASFRGDSRALSSSQLKLTEKKPLVIPPQQELFASFVSPLYKDATNYISYIY